MSPRFKVGDKIRCVRPELPQYKYHNPIKNHIYEIIKILKPEFETQEFWVNVTPPVDGFIDNFSHLHFELAIIMKKELVTAKLP